MWMAKSYQEVNCIYIIVIIGIVVFYYAIACRGAIPDASEVYPLLSFKKAVSDPNNGLKSWNLWSPAPPCDWYGVTCGFQQQTGGMKVVRSLEIPNMRLKGILSPELAKLKFLKVMNLSGNSLSGELNGWMAQMLNLEILDVTDNGFSGVPPPDFLQLRNLIVMKLGGNRFEGDFPGTICESIVLRNVDVSRNNLKGVITEDVAKCAKLEILRLNDNFLHGVIPSEFGDLTQLKVLNLARNKFSGALPDTLGYMTYLTHLYMNNNEFSGFITDRIRDLTYIQPSSWLSLPFTSGEVIQTRYGVIVLELTLKKKAPAGSLSMDRRLPNMTRKFFPHKIRPLVEPAILRTTEASNLVLALIGLALSCTEDSPSNRPKMKTVVSQLKRIKSGETGLDFLEASKSSVPEGNGLFQIHTTEATTNTIFSQPKAQIHPSIPSKLGLISQPPLGSGLKPLMAMQNPTVVENRQSLESLKRIRPMLAFQPLRPNQHGMPLTLGQAFGSHMYPVQAARR